MDGRSERPSGEATNGRWDLQATGRSEEWTVGGREMADGLCEWETFGRDDELAVGVGDEWTA
jgi:hypothetical protein